MSFNPSLQILNDIKLDDVCAFASIGEMEE